MNLSDKTLLFVFILLSNAALSQGDPMKFGKVSKEDLQMTVYEPDTSAAAVILGDYGNVDFLFVKEAPAYHLNRHIRIKILKRAGFDRGDINIPYYSKDRIEDVRALKVKVFAPDGSVTDIDKQDIFDEKVNEYWSQKRFTCPNLKVGSVIDYEYSRESKSIFQLPDWYFQADIPVRLSELRMVIPEWYDYVQISQGKMLDINEKTTGNESYYVPSTFGGSGNMILKTNNYRMVIENAPAIKRESYITTMDDYYARVRFQLSFIKYPSGSFKQILGTWEKLASDLMGDSRFGFQFTKKRNYNKLLEAASSRVPQDGSAEEKIEAIYHFILSNIEVNNIVSIYSKVDLNDCFEKKSARAGEMNMMALALLNEYELEAYPLLVSTRSHGRPMPLYPLVDQFNHVMVLVKNGDQYSVLDASDPNRPFGYPAINSLNSKAWAIIDGNPQWIDMPTPSGSDTYLFNLALDSDGSAVGDFSISSDGYNAVGERDKIGSDPSGKFLQKKLARRYPDATLDSISFANPTELSKPLKAKSQCSIPNVAMASGDFIYLTPSILSSFDETPFKLEHRLYPVDIPYPVKERIIVNIDVPEGYAVEEIPESVRASLPEKGAVFDFRITDNKTTLQLIFKVEINQLHFEPEEYDGLRNFFSLVESKIGEQVVLKKI